MKKLLLTVFCAAVLGLSLAACDFGSPVNVVVNQYQISNITVHPPAPSSVPAGCPAIPFAVQQTDGDSVIVSQLEGGVAPYQLRDNGVPTKSSVAVGTTIDFSSAGVHSLQVFDSAGCPSDVAAVTVTLVVK